MDRDLFLLDLERKPPLLDTLAASIDVENPWADSGINPDSKILFLGMGSSNFAAQIFAARLRTKGINASAELASSELLPPSASDLVVIPISASGSSVETCAALDQYLGKSHIVALTNAVDSELTRIGKATVDMRADVELGGIACRSFQHTLALLMALESQLLRSDLGQVTGVIRKSAIATSLLLDRRGEWLDHLDGLLTGGTGGVHAVAPARRLSSAQQGALMFREGPRIGGTASETGEWSHVDVYLTKTTDYRMLLFAGSTWEPQLFKWTSERGSRVISVGADLQGAAASLRFPHDDDDDVRLLTEIIVAELLAWKIWA
jgi:fructoselysine-6-P-deglycase FrlB-like protein